MHGDQPPKAIDLSFFFQNKKPTTKEIYIEKGRDKEPNLNFPFVDNTMKGRVANRGHQKEKDERFQEIN